MSIIDETGKRYGKLVVLERDFTKPKSNKNGYWLCQCDCGEKTIVLGTKLRKGETKSCGCLRKEKAQQNVVDIKGCRFGRLVVLERIGSTSSGAATWKCQCDCGKQVIVSGGHLRSGHTTSCGCYHNEQFASINLKDISNQRFGKLIAIERTNKKKGTNYIWKCKCDCGNYCETNINNLTQNKRISCGCIKNSKGEDKIINLLKNNNISFQTQKTFDSCRSSKTNCLYKFDFCIENKYLIEFDGIQHFLYKEDSGWNNEENFKKIVFNDNEKNNWCKTNNFPLIRIPYWHYEDLCIEDLKIETSKFII